MIESPGRITLKTPLAVPSPTGSAPESAGTAEDTCPHRARLLARIAKTLGCHTKRRAIRPSRTAGEMAESAAPHQQCRKKDVPSQSLRWPNHRPKIGTIHALPIAETQPKNKRHAAHAKASPSSAQPWLTPPIAASAIEIPARTITQNAQPTHRSTGSPG